MMRVISVAQVDGSVRRIALRARDAELVRINPTKIDSVEPLGVLDVEAGGRRVWARTGPTRIPSTVRDALIAHGELA